MKIRTKEQTEKVDSITQIFLTSVFTEAINATRQEYSNMSVWEVIVHKHNVLEVQVYGGLNGCGEKSEYDIDVTMFCNVLKKRFDRVEIIDEDFDHADDVFGIRFELE
jgi:hypothetical protein